MAGHVRYRRSWTIIPHFLKWTLTGHGVSLNFSAGPFHKSIGTRGTTTDVDLPGKGLYWRDQHYHSHLKNGHPAARAVHGGGFGLFLAAWVVVLQLLIGLAAIYLHLLFSRCQIPNHPLRVLIIIALLELLAMVIVWHLQIARGLLVFLVALAGCYGAWHFLISQESCQAKRPATMIVVPPAQTTTTTAVVPAIKREPTSPPRKSRTVKRSAHHPAAHRRPHKKH